MNRNKNRIIVLYFMKKLQHRLERETFGKISPIFIPLLSKEELQDIVKWHYKSTSSVDFNAMDKKELLQAIGDDILVLHYIIHKWETALQVGITPEKVYEVLYQLELETHYLMTKNIKEWDEYDQSNFNALCSKAGTCQPLYAVFTSSTCEEDKYTCVPLSRYCVSKWESQVQLSYLLVKENLKEHQLKIMSL
jgi:hypothetical protein